MGRIYYKRFNKRKLGSAEESFACDFLESKGYTIIERNFRCRQGEIDIIAKIKDTIVFVEVKTRSSIKFGYPKEAVDYRKQTKIHNVALTYLKLKGKLDSKIRFDVIEILDGSVNHIENCF